MASSLLTDPTARRRALAGAALPALVCALFLASGLGQTAIVPLLPALSSADGLSTSTTALILALPGLAMLAVSVPAGVLADRLGPRRVTLAAGVLMVLGCAAQAAPSLALLLVGRIEFGVAFGVLWTAGAAWLNSLESAGARGIGLAVICSSVGTMVGPGIGGALADGPRTLVPFGVIAVVCAVATAALAWAPGGRSTDRTAAQRADRTGSSADFPALESATPHPATEEHETVGAPDAGTGSAPRRELADTSFGARGGSARSRHVAAGIGSIVVAGALSGATQLLIPAGLHADGMSEGEIGLIFSICALGYIATSAAVVRLGSRAHTLRANAIVTALGAVSLIPALVSGSAAMLVLALMLTAVPRGAINVVAYAVASSVGRAGGSVFGLLNGAWGAATVLVPLAAGSLVQHDGARAGYLAVVLPSAAIALALAMALRRTALRRTALRRTALIAAVTARRPARRRYRDVCDASASPAESSWAPADGSTVCSRRSSSSGM